MNESFFDEIEMVTYHTKKRDRDSIRYLKEAEGIYEEIIDYQNKYVSGKLITVEDFKNKTMELKSKYNDFVSKGYTVFESLEKIMVESYAVCCEASKIFINKTPYKSQVVGGILLNDGIMTEIATGEGKTLTALMPAYLNALTDRSVHILTANDYLSSRDYKTMSKLFEFLGLSCGHVKETNIDYEMCFNYSKEHNCSIKEAQEKLVKEEKQKKQEAYNCDVVYSSVTVAPFDYLRDCTASSLDEVVMRKEKPMLALIDEVDSVLIDDALMNYILSGNSSLKIKLNLSSNEATFKYDDIDSKASQFVESLYEKTDASKIIKKENFKSFVNDANNYPIINKQRYVLIADDQSQVSLTERGQMALFLQYGAYKKFLLQSKGAGASVREFILKGKDEYGEFLYKEGINGDYIVLPNKVNGVECIELTEKGLERISNEVYEFSLEMANIYSSSKWIAFSTQVQNSLTAFYLMDRKKDDYQLEIKEDKSGKKIGHVVCMQHGRIASGRSFSKGIQQALERKEAYFAKNKDYEVEITKENPVIMQTSQRNYYESQYCKFAGMTGTASKIAFDKLYGKTTVEVPKNIEYQKQKEVKRNDHQTVVFLSNEEKYNVIVDDVIRSYNKGQPVLVAATSIEESVIIHNKLKEILGDNNSNIQLLNAEVLKDKSLEAKMIARAGLPSMITVSTEMAGRGTDICLGGSIDLEYIEKDYHDVALDAMKVKFKSDMIKQIKAKNGNISSSQLIQISDIVNAKENSIKENIQNENYDKEVIMDAIVQVASKRKEKVIEVGGLKVIGVGHFPTKREDRQLRGRSGRQDDPSDTIIYDSIDNLINIGADASEVERLKKEINKETKERGSSINYASNKKTSQIISDIQERNADMNRNNILALQDFDIMHSKFQKAIFYERDYVLFDKIDPINQMNKIVNDSISSLVEKNTDIDDLINSVKEVYDVSLDKKDILDKSKNNLNVKEYISEYVFASLDKVKSSMTIDEYRGFLKDRMLDMYDNIWSIYLNNAELFVHERDGYIMAQNDKVPDIESGLTKNYRCAVDMARNDFVSLVLTNQYVKKDNDQIYDVDLDKKIQAASFKVNNLNIRPTMSALLSDSSKLVCVNASGDVIDEVKLHK